MTWGGGMSQSSVPLYYGALNQALIDKQRKGRGYTDKLLLHRNNVEAYYGDDDTIILKLHRTEIVTFYKDGRRMLNMGGWNSPLTKHWLGQVRHVHDIYNVKPNKWTPAITMYGRTNPVKYYNRMMIDPAGEHMGVAPKLFKNVPNAEAVALRKQILAAYNERYLPHLNMMSTKDGLVRESNYGRGMLPSIDDMLSATADEFDVCCGAVIAASYYNATWSTWSATHKLFKKWLDEQYVNEVKRRNMLDEVPYEYNPRR